MGRIRSIKPEIVVDEVTANLPHFEWRLFVSLWLMADDYGNLRGSPGVVKGGTMPEAPESPDAFRRALDHLASPKIALIRFYRVRGQAYIHIRGWSKHQKVDKPGKPLCPSVDEAEPDDVSSPSDDSREPRETVASESGESRDGLAPDWIWKGEEKEGSGGDVPASPDIDPPPPKVRKQPTGDHAALIAAFDAAYQVQTGTAPTWGGKQGAIAKRLLAAHSLADCLDRLARLFAGHLSWLSTPYSIGDLEQHFDKLAPVVNGQRAGPARPAQPQLRGMSAALAASERFDRSLDE